MIDLLLAVLGYQSNILAIPAPKSDCSKGEWLVQESESLKSNIALPLNEKKVTKKLVLKDNSGAK